jgi:hypothetical protein
MLLSLMLPLVVVESCRSEFSSLHDPEEYALSRRYRFFWQHVAPVVFGFPAIDPQSVTYIVMNGLASDDKKNDLRASCRRLALSLDPSKLRDLSHECEKESRDVRPRSACAMRQRRAASIHTSKPNNATFMY